MRLAAKSKKGRERLKRDGADGWQVIRTRDTVQFSSERGPWLFVAKTPDGRGPESRWIHATRDTDFAIVEDDA